MAAPMLTKLFQPTAILRKQIGLLGACRGAHWNKDWQPGPYPKTAEERAAAAKKYNLIPEDYEPYPDDGEGFGDYPKVPLVTGDQRDPFYNWGVPMDRRDYGEPLHIQFDMYGEDRVSNIRPLVPKWEMRLTFLGIVGGSFLLFWIFEHFKYEYKLLPKQMPSDGKTHYTFDPVD